MYYLFSEIYTDIDRLDLYIIKCENEEKLNDIIENYINDNNNLISVFKKSNNLNIKGSFIHEVNLKIYINFLENILCNNSKDFELKIINLN